MFFFFLAQNTWLCEIDVVWVCYRCLHFYSEYNRVKYIHKKQIIRFCGKKQSFKMFTDRIPTMHIEVQKWEFWVFLPANPKPWKMNKINQNQLKINTFTCFVYRGGWRCQQPKRRVPPTTSGRVVYYTILYMLWTHRGLTTPQSYFYIVDPVGIVTARDSANSQTCRKWGNV